MLHIPGLLAHFVAVLLAQAAPPPADKAPEGPPANPSGEKYDGVLPGGNAKNPLPPAPKNQVAQLIWSGFQMADQGSRLFFQTTGAVTFDVKEKKGKPAGLSVFLHNCRIHLKNNKRNLDTRYFATPVRGVTASQRRKDVELRIVLKEPASAVPRTEAGPDGTQFLYLDFPLGKPDAGEPNRPGAKQPVEGAEPAAEPAEPPESAPAKLK